MFPARWTFLKQALGIDAKEMDQTPAQAPYPHTARRRIDKVGPMTFLTAAPPEEMCGARPPD